MKKLFALYIVFSIIPVSAFSQWYGRIGNTLGNWRGFIDNQGRVFNNGNLPGGTWDTTGVVFGGGLWIGGLVNTNQGKRPEVAMTYDPNSAVSMFIPGSNSSGKIFLDSNEITSSKYWPWRSTAISDSLWPERVINGVPEYIDNVPDRIKSGSSYHIGDEDIFSIYKNTDSTFWIGRDSLVPMPQFEIRTQIGFWSEGFEKDVVLVKNQLIYLSQDTLFNPVIALAIDGDIGTGALTANNKMRGFIDSGVQGCLFSSGPNVTTTEPILGIYLLRGTSSAGINDNGITTLRRWTISNDPLTSQGRYNFMTSGLSDVTDNGTPGDMRAMIASASDKAFIKGDTIYFDYALYAEQPSKQNPFDTTAIIENGRVITQLYKSGKLGSLFVPHLPKNEDLFNVYPNPVDQQCNVISNMENIKSIEVYDVLGSLLSKNLYSGNDLSVQFDLRNFAAGIYYAKINGEYFIKVAKR